MNGAARLVAICAVLLVGRTPVIADDAGPAPFETATVRFETNVTDGDVEVVFEVTAGDEGLARLTVTTPDGRTVVDASAPDPSTLGIRQFVLESPEPGDVAALKAAYPQGPYTFLGATAGGRRFNGTARLSHLLPAPADILSPGVDASLGSAGTATVRWSAVPDAVAYTVEIEHDVSEARVTATLPGAVTEFAVPGGFLRRGEAYKLAVATVAANGNRSVVETGIRVAD